jgi:hypothetical protein
LTTNLTMTAPQSTARSLHEICESTRTVDCGVCSALSGDECAYTTALVSLPVTASTLLQPLRGYHVGRFNRAFRSGLISGQDLITVLQAAFVFTLSTVVYDGQPDDAADDQTCPRCGAISWEITPFGLPECTRCLWPGDAS